MWVFPEFCVSLICVPVFMAPLLSDYSRSVRRFLSLGMFLPVSRRSGRHGAVRCAAGTQRSPWHGDASAAGFTPSSHTRVKRNKGKRENAGFPCEENSANLLSESVLVPSEVGTRDASGFVLQNGKVLISPQSGPKFLFSCVYLFAFTAVVFCTFGMTTFSRSHTTHSWRIPAVCRACRTPCWVLTGLCPTEPGCGRKWNTSGRRCPVWALLRWVECGFRVSTQHWFLFFKVWGFFEAPISSLLFLIEQ